jgi:1-pyrroline-5-carboxylate dehydrogenase
VVLKPSHDSPAIAAKFFEVLQEVGIPDGVVNFCPGSGSSFGAGLVEHPQLRFIAFTGSKEVGLDINQRAATPRTGQKWIKRTILEMGGKDSIIVDADANIDAAVEGVAQAAFGFQGQKCSACSRAIIDEKVYDVFLERLKDRVSKITVGDPVENKPMGPVVSEKAYKSILNYIEVGKKEGRVINGGGPAKEAGEGYFIQPTVIADVPPTARIAQEEIFGPVLAVIKARNFDDALAIANNTEFGLTGAVYSTSREKLERARNDFHTGNLYFNRKCTGAIVGAHPFGGFNMSGTDSKAGGPDYLLLYTQAKSVAEKIGDAGPVSQRMTSRTEPSR